MYINVDYYAKSNQDILNMPEGDARNEAAWNETNVCSTKALHAEYSAVSWETVFSHSGHLDVIPKVKEVGYTAVLIYVTTINPEINIECIRIREEHGGVILFLMKK